MSDLSENDGKDVVDIVAGHIDVLHVDTKKGKKAWKRPVKREDAFQVTKGYVFIIQSVLMYIVTVIIGYYDCWGMAKVSR